MVNIKGIFKKFIPKITIAMRAVALMMPPMRGKRWKGLTALAFLQRTPFMVN